MSEFATAQLNKNGQAYHGDDSSSYVEFSIIPQKDEEKSLAEGRPVFRDVEFIEIRFAGDKNKIVKRPVKLEPDQHQPSDVQRWPNQYAAFKAQELQVQDGTPITEWGPITKSQALELKAINIHTVEALAATADGNLTWMGARTLRDQAKAWLDKAKDGASTGQLVKEKEDLAAQVEVLTKQVKDLASQLETQKTSKAKNKED